MNRVFFTVAVGMTVASKPAPSTAAVSSLSRFMRPSRTISSSLACEPLLTSLTPVTLRNARTILPLHTTQVRSSDSR